MVKQSRLKQRFSNFSQALERLEESLDQGSWQVLEQDGVIKRFEFTFELAWKTLQDYFESEGFTEVHGPKTCIKEAFQSGLIEDGEMWMNILQDRNLMVHTYNAESSQNLFEKIKDLYFQALCDLYHALEKKIS